MEHWEIFSLSGSSESEEQFDLHKLEMVLLTWLARNNECGDITQSGAGPLPPQSPKLGHCILDFEKKDYCDFFFNALEFCQPNLP